MCIIRRLLQRTGVTVRILGQVQRCLPFIVNAPPAPAPRPHCVRRTHAELDTSTLKHVFHPFLRSDLNILWIDVTIFSAFRTLHQAHNCNKRVWQHALPNRTLRSRQLDVTQAMVTYLPCYVLSIQLRNFLRGLYYIIRESSAKYTVTVRARGRRPRAARAFADSNDIQLIVRYIHRVRKSTSVPHFLYCITAMCRFTRTLPRQACVSAGPSSH